MTTAWETSEDDVRTVLDRHGVKLSDERVSELHDGLDNDEIESNVLRYTDMDNQTSSMLDDIENHLIAEGVVTGPKKFVMSEMEVEEDDIEPEDQDEDDGALDDLDEDDGALDDLDQ